MFSRKSLLLIIVSCWVFQNVFSSPALLDPVRGAIRHIRCGLHHIGQHILSHEHKHHDPCHSHHSYSDHHHEGGSTGVQGFKLGFKAAFAGGLGVGVAGIRARNALNETVAEYKESKPRNALNETVAEDKSVSKSTSKSQESNKDGKIRTTKEA